MALDNTDLVVRIAWLYYQEQMTQEAIARRFSLSRSKVMRLLKQARQEGIVRFQIVGSYGNCLAVEKELIETFGLEDAMIVPSASPERTKDVIGTAAAMYLERHLEDGQLLAVGWGRTLHKMAEHIVAGQFQNLRVVNLMGGLTTSLSLNPYDIGSKLAATWAGECYYVYAPAIAASEELCRSFQSELTVRTALQMARVADYALVGIGDVGPQSTLAQMGYISVPEMEVLRRQGAVGNILAQYFDVEGRKVSCQLHRRIVSLSIEQLRDHQHVIGIAGGEHKTEAILGALQGGFISALVSEEKTARALLKLREAAGS